MKTFTPPERTPNGLTVLDPYSCQGGAAMGWHLAGYEVTGVDKDPQPRYPFTFIQGDAVEYIRAHGHEYDLIAGSPPCQAHTLCQRIQGREHPRLIAPTRAAMEATGRPWIIENVEEAAPELRNPVMLCGASFPGLHTYRHRLFEAGGGITLTVPEHPRHLHPIVKMGRPLKSRDDYLREGQDRDGDWYHAVGNFSGVPYVARDMGVEWMSRDGIRECIPPVYIRFLGEQVTEQLLRAGVAA
jgi:DNA (cytosine-5)-methyltransferase 1